MTIAALLGLGSVQAIIAAAPDDARQQHAASLGHDASRGQAAMPNYAKADRPGAAGMAQLAPGPEAVAPTSQPAPDPTRHAAIATQPNDVAPAAKPVVRQPALAEAPAAAVTAVTHKAVVIVGPSGEAASNLVRAEELARAAELYGMDVRRIYHPHATWANVLANIQGANLVAYFGHGNSWPSPYGPFQERTKDGFGLNRRDGGSAHDVRYYGANFIRRDVVLAPNAVVLLNHLCYSAGNGEPGMGVPAWDVAWQRVDNYASGFLAVGARAVFAYATGSVTPIVGELFESDKSMDEIFMTIGARRQPFYGFTGWDDRYFESSRTPGFRNHLDPGRIEGFRRALTGDLMMTTAQWRAGTGSG